MTVLKVSGLGKAFRVYKSELQRVARWFGFKGGSYNETWVCKDIGFSMNVGESVGIIGRNGAGKSTLLKMITGTLTPSEGSISVGGRISAVLELGIGFNLELTGRQNVYHSAGLMGFSVAQINDVIDEVESFVEIGNYFDEAVRTYSSGMQVRVAFAVATIYRPEILIIDEALSVGDAYFQHKSFDRIRSFQGKGTTILFVSHDQAAVQTLCDRAILLDKGRLLKEGKPSNVFDYYNALIAERENSRIELNEKEDEMIQTISGTGEVTIEEVCLLNSRKENTETVFVGEQVTMLVKTKVHKPIEKLVLGFMVKDRLGNVIFGTNTFHTNQIIYDPEEGEEYAFSLGFLATLGAQTYSIALALVSSDTHLDDNYEWRDLALVFEVINNNENFFVGSTFLSPEIDISKVAK